MTIGNLAIMTAMLATASGSAAMSQPLTLVADAADGIVRLTVKGLSATRCEARYELDVASGASGRTNRSRQSGVARLAPGKTAMVATVTLGKVDGDDWSARLSVSGCGAPPYELLANSRNGGT